MTDYLTIALVLFAINYTPTVSLVVLGAGVGAGPQAATVAFAIVPAPTLILPVIAAVPKSPVPHPSAFRGPPQLSFS